MKFASRTKKLLSLFKYFKRKMILKQNRKLQEIGAFTQFE
jgi:hypothetical protein